MPRRDISAFKQQQFDVLIIGGGVNGAGVARDLVLRQPGRLKVGLVEQNHFSSGTSGKNSQLIHGGLRYLKYFEFPLVREALHERATLLKIAPHLVHRQPFILPFYGYFDFAFYGAGLTLYDLLAGSHNIGRHQMKSASAITLLEPGLDAKSLKGGAIFYDCQVHSARLVIENIFDAMNNGAAAANYVRLESMRRDGPTWNVTLHDRLSSETFTCSARKIVDARGPWTDQSNVRLVRGSHIILPRIGASENAISYFDENGRIVFLIPWGENKDCTLVGTTDVDHASGPDSVQISEAEKTYLLSIVSRLYPHADRTVLSTYSSLRPLAAPAAGSATAATREHHIANDEQGILRISGGKYTTYRSMSEEAADLVVEELAPELRGRCVTAQIPLQAPSLPASTEERIRYIVENEMAQRLADILYVSTYWGYERKWDRASLQQLAEVAAQYAGWSQQKITADVEAILN